ncbi:MAG: tRNA (adenosine(37)-N6)-threonylcarbamoyltransferase complex dimerization subunit type 1 TsaB [Candidatus Babeliales bacterium]|jgi:tRNA threonylcarbamoyladenosine biosynthesis protein TsaB
MTTFIAVQNTYQKLELALFANSRIIGKCSTGNQEASKEFIPLLSSILKQNKIALQEFSFIVANQGPGPFSTLRVVISSVNGISFASTIPLIGIDGLNAFIQQYNNPDYPYTVVLLNAFNKDVYFAVQQPDKPIEKGYKKIDQLLDELTFISLKKPIRFLGNGVQLYQDKIKKQFNENAYIPSPLPHNCSLEQIAQMGLQKWQKQEGIINQLFPLYLKKHASQQ